MSTSTSPSAQIESGECVVCGNITTKRCSSCAASGTDWMFFCSIEHQKLVSLPLPIRYAYIADDRDIQIWFVHKRVCGVRSTPYSWPRFSPEEVEDMLEISQKPYATTVINGVQSSCWLDSLFEKNAAPPEKRVGLFKVSLRRLSFTVRNRSTRWLSRLTASFRTSTRVVSGESTSHTFRHSEDRTTSCIGIEKPIRNTETCRRVNGCY